MSLTNGLGNASLIFGIGGGISSALGSYFQADSQKSSLNFQSQMADINAQIANIGAENEIWKGQQEIATQTLQAGQLKSSQRAAMAANGIDLGFGSAAEVQASTDIVKNIDMTTIQSNAIRAAFGYKQQALNDTTQGALSRASADGISPGATAMNSLVGSAGSVASTWYKMKRAGVTG
jgi:hypothetical protein